MSRQGPQRDRARAEWSAARACLRSGRRRRAAAADHLLSAAASLLATGEALVPRARLPALATGGALSHVAGELAELARRLEAHDAIARRTLVTVERALAASLGEAGAPRWLVPAALASGLLLVGLVVLMGRGGSSHGSGFVGAYYPEREFAGEPVLRDDPVIDFAWLGESPIAGVPADMFSVRWRGCFELASAERLTFRVGSDDGSRVLLDGEQIVDNWRDQGGNWMEETLEVSPGVHELSVEYYERGGDAMVVFELSRGGAPAGAGFVWPPPDGGQGACRVR